MENTRKKHIKIITSTCLALFISFSENSYAAGYPYGTGLKSCSSWNQMRSTQDGWHQGGQWVNGFITAGGYFGPHTLRKSNPDEILAFMDSFCRQNQFKTIKNGAEALYEYLRI